LLWRSAPGYPAEFVNHFLKIMSGKLFCQSIMSFNERQRG
jgi:hypothetical protein